MKSININFTLTEGEYELLRLGKCDKPNADRVKRMLLQEAAKNLRNMIDSVLRPPDAEDWLLAKVQRRLDREQRAKWQKGDDGYEYLKPGKGYKPVSKLPSFHWAQPEWSVRPAPHLRGEPEPEDL